MVRNRRNVALLFAVYFLQGLCFYSPVATLYRLEAGLTLFQTGLLESISLAAMLLLEIPWGRAADRIGHRRTLVICSALFALSKVVFWKARAFPDRRDTKTAPAPHTGLQRTPALPPQHWRQNSGCRPWRGRGLFLPGRPRPSHPSSRG